MYRMLKRAPLRPVRRAAEYAPRAIVAAGPFDVAMIETDGRRRVLGRFSSLDSAVDYGRRYTAEAAPPTGRRHGETTASVHVRGRLGPDWCVWTGRSGQGWSEACRPLP